jgi:hypothetical protein
MVERGWGEQLPTGIIANYVIAELAYPPTMESLGPL